MAKNNAAPALVLCLIVVSTSMPASECSSVPAPVAREEDVQYIKCQVCEKLATQLYRQVQSKRAEISPEEITEQQITEIAKNLCNSEKKEAVWIRKIDIVEQGNMLKLEEQDGEGYCNSECKTLQKACEEVLNESDDIYLEYLNKTNPRIDGMVDFLCGNVTDACIFDPPPLPKDLVHLSPMPCDRIGLPEEADVERNAKSSTESTPGAPCTNMYSTDESTNAKNSGEEDKDEGTHCHSKLGVRRHIKSFFGGITKYFTGDSEENSETRDSEL